MRNFAERTALNSPLQGTAADLIKLAMIRIDQRLRQEKFAAQMILQVHDELLFESPPDEQQALEALVRKEMEEVHKLAVPLMVEICAGPNWRDLDYTYDSVDFEVALLLTARSSPRLKSQIEGGPLSVTRISKTSDGYPSNSAHFKEPFRHA